MDFQTITPIQRITTFGGVSPVNNTAKAVTNADNQSVGASFSDMYMSLIGNYTAAQAQVDQDSADLAAGSIDDLHNVTINATKADIALNLATSVTSKVLTAYDEIMKMNI